MAVSSHLNTQQLIAGVLHSVERRSADSSQISDEDILLLHSTFGSVFQRACEVVDRDNSITLYFLEDSPRTAAEVKGSPTSTYRLIPDINFCPCPAFQLQVLKFSSSVTCKHVLALYLALIFGKYTEQIVTHEQYCSIVYSIYSIELPQEVNKPEELKKD